MILCIIFYSVKRNKNFNHKKAILASNNFYIEVVKKSFDSLKQLKAFRMYISEYIVVNKNVYSICRILFLNLHVKNLFIFIQGNPYSESGDPGFVSQIFVPTVLNKQTSTYSLSDGITAVDLNYCKRTMRSQSFTNIKSYRYDHWKVLRFLKN